MQVHVYRNGKQLGPYEANQLKGLLNSNQISYDDLAWIEGMTEWKPLRVIFAKFTPPDAPVAYHRRFSNFYKACMESICAHRFCKNKQFLVNFTSKHLRFLFAVIVCALIGIYSLWPSGTSSIKHVLQADSEISDIVRNKRDASQPPATQVAHLMRGISLSGCPQKFKEAYVQHIHAWDDLGHIQTQVKQFGEYSNSEEVLTEAFVRGAQGDPFGKVNEYTADLQSLRARYTEAQEHISSTYHNVEDVALEYGVTVSQKDVH